MAECLSPELRLGGLKRSRNEPMAGAHMYGSAFHGGFPADFHGFDENTSMQTQEEAPQRRAKRARMGHGDRASSPFAAAQSTAQLRHQITQALQARHEEDKKELVRRAEAQVRDLQSREEEERGQLARALHESREENRILKRAVKVLNGKHNEAERKGRELEATLQQASDYVRKLEQTNYALRVHLEQASSATHLAQRPPDVF